ncbi:SufE family protein [Bradyrhizobium valentinum]|uniref:Fe-S metabolism associated domain-containing protein n=1 Tax=Bradyrhizobium valentinum TaxID=1518501 RepID=A0A0R3LBU0_9BRAD|nr:SufE family protein [Bradyrhizobium valentinum]KRR04718.1 hypothetical protein CP49_18615 [Bradyrhizobium valentinum]
MAGPLPEIARDEAPQLQGCVSQSGSPLLRSPTAAHLVGDGRAHIAPGLVAILIPMLLGRPAREIVAADPQALLECLEHLKPQRSYDFRSMVFMRVDAQAALADAP